MPAHSGVSLEDLAVRILINSRVSGAFTAAKAYSDEVPFRDTLEAVAWKTPTAAMTL